MTTSYGGLCHENDHRFVYRNRSFEFRRSLLCRARGQRPASAAAGRGCFASDAHSAGCRRPLAKPPRHDHRHGHRQAGGSRRGGRAQINGKIASFGPDPADPSRTVNYGTVVHKGTVLAEIDPTIYKAQVAYAQASLTRAKADLLQLLAKCNQMKQEWQRAQSLLPQKAIADTDYDLVSANYQAANGSVAAGRAAIQQCEASLEQARTYLSYTVITSPIDGVIIDRRVNVGQIVCASFNVPGLFVVAKDLRRIQVCASVDETDIGRIQTRQPARFTVDAYPGEVFEGKVDQIRLNPTKTEGHTTYTVVVASDNPRGMLPFLTAKLCFEVGQYATHLPALNMSPGERVELPKTVPGLCVAAVSDLSSQAEGAKTGTNGFATPAPHSP